MLATLPAPVQLATYDIYTDTDSQVNLFATIEMSAIRPFGQPLSNEENVFAITQSLDKQFTDEELHIAFEAAISDRMLNVGRHVSQWRHYTRLYQEEQTDKRQPNSMQYTARPAHSESIQPGTIHSWLNRQRWKRIRYVCFLCLLPLIGFDCMGLLVLHAR